MTTTVIKVSGMMCGNCQKHVQDLIESIEGVQEVEVSLEKEEAEISYDETLIDEQSFYEAFKDSNYSIE